MRVDALPSSLMRELLSEKTKKQVYGLTMVSQMSLISFGNPKNSNYNNINDHYYSYCSNKLKLQLFL